MDPRILGAHAPRVVGERLVRGDDGVGDADGAPETAVLGRGLADRSRVVALQGDDVVELEDQRLGMLPEAVQDQLGKQPLLEDGDVEAARPPRLREARDEVGRHLLDGAGHARLLQVRHVLQLPPLGARRVLLLGDEQDLHGGSIAHPAAAVQNRGNLPPGWSVLTGEPITSGRSGS